MLRRLGVSPTSTTGHAWTAVAGSAAAHAALVCGLWWAGLRTQSGIKWVLEMPHGESSAIAITASFASRPQPQVWETAEERPTAADLLADPPQTQERMHHVVESTAPRRTATWSDARKNRSVSAAEVRISRDDQDDLSAQPQQRVAPHPTRPAPASQASAAALQDLGVRRPPLPNRKSAPPLVYPPAAFEAGWEGVVQVMVTVNASGKVTGARLYRTSGHDVLDHAAIEWIKKWHFEVETEWFLTRPEIKFRAPVRFSILDAEGR